MADDTQTQTTPPDGTPAPVVNGNGKRDRIRDYIMGLIGVITVLTLAWLANQCMTHAPQDGNYVYQSRGDLKEVLIFILGYFGGQVQKGSH